MYKVIRYSKTEIDLDLLSTIAKQTLGRSISGLRDKRERKSKNESFVISMIDAMNTVDHEDDLMTLYPVNNLISYGYIFMLPEFECLKFVSYLKYKYVILDTSKPSFKLIVASQTLQEWEETIMQSSQSSLFDDIFKQVYDDLRSDGLTKHWREINVH